MNYVRPSMYFVIKRNGVWCSGEGRENAPNYKRRQADSLESLKESAEGQHTSTKGKRIPKRNQSAQKRDVEKRSGLGGCSYKAELVLVTFRRLSHRLSIDN